MASKNVKVEFTNDEINGIISHFMEVNQVEESKYAKLKRMADDIGNENGQMLFECAKQHLASKIFFEHILKKLTDAQHKSV